MSNDPEEDFERESVGDEEDPRRGLWRLMPRWLWNWLHEKLDFS